MSRIGLSIAEVILLKGELQSYSRWQKLNQSQKILAKPSEVIDALSAMKIVQFTCRAVW
jgi:hypothetical protein